MTVSVWLATSVVVSRYLSHSPRHQNFGSYFLVFGKCGITPHRLYRDSLTFMSSASRFTCGERKIWSTVKKSQNIKNMIEVRSVSKLRSYISVKALKSLVTIRMNKIFPCLTFYGQKINFFCSEIGTKINKHKLCERKRRRWSQNNFFKRLYLRSVLTSSWSFTSNYTAH